nr:hypothetical protein [Tanacetum cinerariifolium]
MVDNHNHNENRSHITRISKSRTGVMEGSSICYDDDEEHTIPLSDIISQLPSSIVITNSPFVLPIEDPRDSLIMGNEDINTIPEKESDEFIKSSVEYLVPIPSESEDTSGSYSEYIFPSCNDFSPIDISEGKSVTFSNLHFNSNDDFTSSDDESLSDEDPKDNVKIYSNPLFEFDDEYISSDINPLFDEVLEDIECKNSYASNLDESTFLVTPLFDFNEDEYFAPSDDVDLLLQHDLSIPKMRVASILEGLEAVIDGWLGLKLRECLQRLEEIPYGEIKAHIEILSVLWGNRIPTRMVHYRCLGRGSPGRNKTSGPWSARITIWQLFKGLGHTYDTLAIPWNTISGFDVEGNQGLKLIDQELVMVQWPGLKIEERLKGLESSSHHYK